VPSQQVTGPAGRPEAKARRVTAEPAIAGQHHAGRPAPGARRPAQERHRRRKTTVRVAPSTAPAPAATTRACRVGVIGFCTSSGYTVVLTTRHGYAEASARPHIPLLPCSWRTRAGPPYRRSAQRRPAPVAQPLPVCSAGGSRYPGEGVAAELVTLVPAARD